MSNQLSYQPSTYYYRQQIETARTKAEVVRFARDLVLEHERLREWVRSHGIVPPKWFVSPLESQMKIDRPLAKVIPFPTTTASSETAT